MRYSEKTVVITGGTKGIGHGCAEVFAEEGANVFFCGLEPELGAKVAAEISARGPGRATFTACDVTDTRALRVFIDAAARAHDRLDCLVNNAGWHPPHRSTDEFTADEFRALLELNLIAPFLASQAALPWLRQTRGAIINIASLVGSMGQLHATTYVATKAAMIGSPRRSPSMKPRTRSA
jgi:NAD(P)-dependent dehydrogenase (short-subunit alcohol dehydrogenase family)